MYLIYVFIEDSICFIKHTLRQLLMTTLLQSIWYLLCNILLYIHEIIWVNLLIQIQSRIPFYVLTAESSHFYLKCYWNMCSAKSNITFINSEFQTWWWLLINYILIVNFHWVLTLCEFIADSVKDLILKFSDLLYVVCILINTENP